MDGFLCFSNYYWMKNRKLVLIVCNRNRAWANKVKGSLEEGAVDKLLVGELGEDLVQHGDGHQD